MEGWQGWDDYAAFYDWENARTVGRRDVGFWREFARAARGPVVELGCGTGRVTLPLARAGLPVIGVDRSADMLAHARRRLRRARVLGHPANVDRRPRRAGRLLSSGGATRPPGAALVRADIRRLPLAPGSCAAVLAPYGILQSLLCDRDLTAALEAVASVLVPGGRFGVDLVPDVPRWKEYRRRVSLVGRKGRTGPLVTLIESVRQDRARRLTIFDHEYVVGWGGGREVHQFTVRFRTIPVQAMLDRLARAGFAIEATHGGYHGEPLDDAATAWVVLARRERSG